jgi:hypothetical protein
MNDAAINGLGNVQGQMDDQEMESSQKRGVSILYFIVLGIAAMDTDLCNLPFMVICCPFVQE